MVFHRGGSMSWSPSTAIFERLAAIRYSIVEPAEEPNQVPTAETTYSRSPDARNLQFSRILPVVQRVG
jgi:hypothetical protein